MEEFVALIKPILRSLITYLLPIISSILAIDASIKARKAQKVDDRLKALELIIKEFQVKEIESKINKIPAPNINTRVIKEASNKFVLKVWNSGEEKAFNINVSIPKESSVTLLATKLPYEYLDPGGSFEENLLFYLGSQRKFEVTAVWEDKEGNKNSSTNLLSI